MKGRRETGKEHGLTQKDKTEISAIKTVSFSSKEPSRSLTRSASLKKTLKSLFTDMPSPRSGGKDTARARDGLRKAGLDTIPLISNLLNHNGLAA